MYLASVAVQKGSETEEVEVEYWTEPWARGEEEETMALVASADDRQSLLLYLYLYLYLFFPPL